MLHQHLQLTMIGLLVAVAVPTSFTIAQEETLDYATHIQPIFDKHCLACHNDEDNEGGFIATSFETLIEGHDNGDSFVASESLESTIVRLMNGDDEPLMPPDDRPRPTEEEIATIAKWIDEGAKPSTMNPPSKKAKPSTPFSLNVPKLGRGDTLKGFDGVTAADWSPTDSRIAMGSFQRVSISDPGTRQLVKEFGGIVGKVNSLRYSSDGEWLVASSGMTGKAGQAIIWDVESGDQVQSLEGHADSIYSAVISPDKATLATSSYDRKIILWNVESGEPILELTGHNGAVYDLDFSPDSKSLISASADQTLKLWDAASGKRLRTFGRPLKEQLVCRFHPDGKLIFGAGRDNRIRIWKYDPRAGANDDPFLQSVFAHEGPIIGLDFSADGSRLVSTSEDRTTKVWDTKNFRQIEMFADADEPLRLEEIITAIAMSPDGKQVYMSDMTRRVRMLTVEEEKEGPVEETEVSSLDKKTVAVTAKEFTEFEPNNGIDNANKIVRNSTVVGKIFSDGPSDVDLFEFTATKGQKLTLEIKAERDDSKLDSRIEILDQQGNPVPRVLLAATLDSYFTFRGKDSDNSDDGRIHTGREMEINDYLYCNGEVARLFQHPRGPDSGFILYPGSGKRHGYFGTTPIAHALHEPCYRVKPYPVGTELPANGLPTFTINYENDDASMRDLGKDSRLLFNPPEDGKYFVRVSDVRGFSGADFAYKLTVRPAKPGFSVAVKTAKSIKSGGGTDFEVIGTRIDGFDGPIKVIAENVPEGLRITSPIVIESGHERAFGTVHAFSEDIAKEAIEGIRWTASARIENENEKQQVLESAGEVTMEKPFEIKESKPKIELRIVSTDTDSEKAFESVYDDRLRIQLRPGEMVEAKVVAKRIKHKARISLGMADAGRNLPRGVYVDDIGLNGLMITKNNSEQVFYISCDDWVEPQVRTFYVRATDVENEASWPVEIEVLPK